MNILEVSYLFPSTIEEIDGFSGKDFEEFLFHFFAVMGLDPRITNDSDDKGIDLMIKMTPDSEKRVIGIQAKRWKGNVGPNEIRKMLDGKNHYNLEDLRIITTSKLTSSAKTTALNNHIRILDRDRVEQFLRELKERDDIQFRTIKKRTVSSKNNDNEKKNDHINGDLVNRLRSLRIELSKSHKLHPVYMVYSNRAIDELSSVLPSTLKDLAEIKGLGPKKVDLFGKDILDVIDQYRKESASPELIAKLKSIRTRIMKYNQIEDKDDVYTDDAISEMLLTKPKTISDLEKIGGVKNENLSLFGDYLINKISELY